MTNTKVTISSRGNFDTTLHTVGVRPWDGRHTTQQTASHRPVQSPIHALSNEHSSESSWARSPRQDARVHPPSSHASFGLCPASSLMAHPCRTWPRSAPLPASHAHSGTAAAIHNQHHRSSCSPLHPHWTLPAARAPAARRAHASTSSAARRPPPRVAQSPLLA